MSSVCLIIVFSKEQSINNRLPKRKLITDLRFQTNIATLVVVD